MGELSTALDALAATELTARCTALRTVCTMLRNVLDNPTETKYRRVRTENAAFVRKVGSHKGALDVLRVAGFRDGEEQGVEQLTLHRDDPGLLWLVVSMCKDQLQEWESSVA